MRTPRSQPADTPGKLDLALLELRQLPHELYIDLLGLPVDELSNPPPAPKKDESVRTPGKPGKGAMEDSFSRLGFGGDESDEDSRSIVFNQPRPQGKWVEPEELTAFKANGNMLKEIDLEVGLFGGLKNLDVSYICDWKQLTATAARERAFPPAERARGPAPAHPHRPLVSSCTPVRR